MNELIYDLPNEPTGLGTFDEDNSKREINLSKIDNIEFDDVDHSDYPDYCDAFISSADMFGHPMSEEELNDLNENHVEWVHEKLIEKLF
jgi:GTPase SAR1 family protein